MLFLILQILVKSPVDGPPLMWQSLGMDRGPRNTHRRTRRALLVRMPAALAACLAVAAIGFATRAPAAAAATYTVGTISDTTGTCENPAAGTCSLRQLIAYENNAGTNDTIVVPVGSYSLTNGQLDLTQNMTIAGAGARTTSIAQESESSRVFAILGDSETGFTPTVTISGLDMLFGTADSASTPAYFGGNVVNEGTLTLSEDFVERGTTTFGSGAGISNYGGTLTVTHSLIASNGTAQTNDSGGIQNVGPNPITNSPAKLTVVDSTIADNTAAQGGGIMSWSDSGNTATIINSTITGNDGGARATVGGGLLAADGGTISVENSIVAGNTVDNPSAGTPSNCGETGSTPGTIKSVGHNIESATDCGFGSTGDQQSTDPGFLSGISGNGGNTNTFALKATSPAVDAIPAGAPDCSGNDQRDISRPQGTGCDIGAYELFQPIEGLQFTTVVGQIGATSATITWGDGTAASAGAVDSLGQVTGTHTYAEEGIYHAQISWKNSDGASETTPFDVKVADAPLTASPVNFTAVAGTSFNGSVATFTDANPGGQASDFTASIAWGDGTQSAGKVTSSPSGGFIVTGTHTYASTGGFKTTVTINDVGGASATAQGSATVNPPAPTVTTVSPTAGPTGGGTSVTITGTNLANATAVKFGTTSGAITANSATQITATAPAGTGTVDITVTTTGGTSATNANDRYTYVPAPTVTSVSPTAGPTTGGTTVTITGTNLTGATAVKFGVTNATSFTVTNASQITATAPAGTGTVDITVTTTGGTSATNANDRYTYVPAPTVTSVSPTAGPDDRRHDRHDHRHEPRERDRRQIRDHQRSGNSRQRHPDHRHRSSRHRHRRRHRHDRRRHQRDQRQRPIHLRPRPDGHEPHPGDRPRDRRDHRDDHGHQLHGRYSRQVRRTRTPPASPSTAPPRSPPRRHRTPVPSTSPSRRQAAPAPSARVTDSSTSAPRR